MPTRGDRAGPLATIEMERGKLDALTGLRFFAAALIVAEHATMLRVRLPAWGYDHGVSLFFVLSGFILAHVYPQLDDWRSACRFLVLRVRPHLAGACYGAGALASRDWRKRLQRRILRQLANDPCLDTVFALVFFVQRAVVEHLHRVFLLSGFSAPDPSLATDLVVEMAWRRWAPQRNDCDWRLGAPTGIFS